MSEQELSEEVYRLADEHRKLGERIEQSKQILIEQRQSLAAVIDATRLPKSERDNLKRVIGG